MLVDLRNLVAHIENSHKYAQYYILTINCNFKTLYTNVVPGVDDVLHLRNFGL